MSDANTLKVSVWLNEKSHKIVDINADTTCSQVAGVLVQALRIPHAVRSYFALHTTAGGKDQGALNESENVMEVLMHNQKHSNKWGDSKDNGFVYVVNEDTLAQVGGKSHLPQEDHHLRKGIGHQRSKSSPAVTSGLQRGVAEEKEAIKTQYHDTGRTHRSNAQIIDERYPQEKRSATPIPNRESSVPALQEEKDEAKGLGIGTAPHLEPRSANVSPSPPRASLKARSKTISTPVIPGLIIKSSSGPSSANHSPLASPTFARARGISPSPRGTANWDESLSKGGSLGRSQGNSRTRRTSMSIFDPESSDSQDQGASGKGSRTSPPPPRQRYTPPPTILSPMIGSVLGNAALPPSNTTSPLTRLRAQTTGSKPMPQKWVKVRATKPGINTTGTNEVGEMLLHTLDRLKTET